MTHLASENFDANARAALQDETLRGALKKATDLFGSKRAAAVESLPEWEELREEARRIKDEALLNLDRYLEQFEERATEAGARIHWASDAREACEIVSRITKEAGARRLVKSKSMTTEEVHLNEALEREGTLPIETDLGEWIIQLAGEAPSHIIAPAIHKTKGQVADLFVEKLAIEPTDDIEELTRTARRVLRQHFAESDLGVSGVNFAVAETGTILILENEGNARLTTSLPRVHVAMMGIEKVLPRFDDLEVFLRLLPRSGTGQHLTSYQSILTGPGASEGDGPEELHIVILDNGRTGMLRDRVTRQSLACIRCGACLNVCPVYQAIGGHAYGSVYPGPIGAIITPQLSGVEKASQLPFASSLCGACGDVCPVKIDIPELLLELRTRVVSRTGLPHSPGSEHALPPRRLERLAFRAWSWTMRSPLGYRCSAFLGRLFLRNSLGRWLAGHLVGPWKAWEKLRDLRPPARKSFRQIWESELSKEDPRA